MDESQKDYVKLNQLHAVSFHGYDILEKPTGTEIRSVVARDTRYGEEIYYKGTQAKHSGDGNDLQYRGAT